MSCLSSLPLRSRSCSCRVYFRSVSSVLCFQLWRLRDAFPASGGARQGPVFLRRQPPQHILNGVRQRRAPTQAGGHTVSHATHSETTLCSEACRSSVSAACKYRRRGAMAGPNTSCRWILYEGSILVRIYQRVAFINAKLMGWKHCVALRFIALHASMRGLRHDARR